MIRQVQDLAYELAGEFITEKNAHLLIGAKLADHVRVEKGQKHDFIKLEIVYRVTKRP